MRSGGTKGEEGESKREQEEVRAVLLVLVQTFTIIIQRKNLPTKPDCQKSYKKV